MFARFARIVSILRFATFCALKRDSRLTRLNLGICESIRANRASQALTGKGGLGQDLNVTESSEALQRVVLYMFSRAGRVIDFMVSFGPIPLLSD